MKHTRESILALIAECRKNGNRIDLSGQDLSELDLSDADLHDADLQDADLQDADLRWADLQDADLRWANLRWANLQEADLHDADLQDADLRWADLQDADMRWANLRWANLQEADLQEADFDFAGYELSCRTIGVKVGRRLVSQLLYHMCRMDVQDCPEWDELRNDERVIALANQSHVMPVHGLPEIKPLKAREEEK